MDKIRVLIAEDHEIESRGFDQPRDAARAELPHHVADGDAAFGDGLAITIGFQHFPAILSHEAVTSSWERAKAWRGGCPR